MAAAVTTAAAIPLPVSAPAGPAPFSLRIAGGLIGVLLAVLVSGFNEHVTEIDLPDMRGALGIGHDEGTWLTAIYEAFQISAMAFAPWFAVTFSIRRFTVAMVALFGALAAVAPFVPDLPSLYALRAVQGFAGGCMPPMLMTVALRYLPPGIKIYGLGAYALTATFGPNLGTPLAAFWFESFGWRWVFWEIIPFCVVAIALVAAGLPQDPLRLERFRQFDWRGLLLGGPGICMLVFGLMQGDRLDWFNSPFIVHMLVGGVFLFGLFMVNEWFHPAPFFRIQMLRQRNLSFALITITGVLMMVSVTAVVPSLYLVEVRGYRPLQIAPMALVVALPQLVALPLVAALCNIRWVDCRWVLAGGLMLIALSCLGGTLLTSDWIRDNFFALQALLVLGQPMTIIPILMLATLKLAPTDGPFVSGMFNMVKGLANVIAAAVVDILLTWREHLHSNVLLDGAGRGWFARQAGTAAGQNSPQPAVLAALAHAVHDQALVLASADIYLVMVGVAVVMLLLNLILPQRVYPPAAVAMPSTR